MKALSPDMQLLKASFRALSGVFEITYLACLHDQNKSGFFGGPAFFQPIRAFRNFCACV